MTELDVRAVTTLQIGTTAAISLVSALLFDRISVLQTVTPTAWTIVVYLAILCSIAAYLLQNAAVAHLSSSAVSMLQCTQPLMTAGVSFLLLGERLTATGWIGGALIIGCMVLDSVLGSRLTPQAQP